MISQLQIFAPHSRMELIDYAFEQKSILVAVNAEKILHSTEETRAIINRNVGYPDGIGAVWTLKKKGFKNAIKIPGCELWLDIITQHPSATFYLVGGSEEVIQETIKRLKVLYPQIAILNYRNGFLKNNEEKTALINDVAEKNRMWFLLPWVHRNKSC